MTLLADELVTRMTLALLPTVGRCSLTASKPVLKAPMVSALEAKI